MPELPEVETTRRSLEPLIGATVTAVTVHHAGLRWPVPADLARLMGQTLQQLSRRSKYLLMDFESDGVLWHLGMSGSLTHYPAEVAATRERRKHDHIILTLARDDLQWELRYHDPRRFGCCLWLESGQHTLLDKLGPEPLTDEFTADYLLSRTQNRTAPIKNVIMDNAVVVGVGNIYATEALFKTGIHPARAAHTLTALEAQALVQAIQQTLQASIELGGSTLRDYVNGLGENGYFQQALLAYGRAGENCHNCDTPIATCRLGQRASAFCPNCQPLERKSD